MDFLKKLLPRSHPYKGETGEAEKGFIGESYQYVELFSIVSHTPNGCNV